VAFEVLADTDALSYATTSDAEDLSEVRIGSTAFDALSEETQEKHLNSAARDLDTVAWIGSRASAEQELEWPRTGTGYSSDAWPSILVEATILLAWYNAKQLETNPDADIGNPETSVIKREKVGPIETEYFAPSTTVSDQLSRFPAHVRALIRPLVYVAAAAGYGSAIVTRGS
jgi:hypothetical protein